MPFGQSKSTLGVQEGMDSGACSNLERKSRGRGSSIDSIKLKGEMTIEKLYG
jgi:hypothetical protein